jgi:D-alanyl-D-alanine dipeptidase
MASRIIQTLHHLAFLTVIAASCTPLPKVVPQKPPIISSVSEIREQISLDSNQAMIPLKNIIPNLITDWKYASYDNFTREILYKTPEAFLRKEPAEALVKVNKELNIIGLGIILFDAYRPYRVTRKMWAIVPDERYAANPAKGSGHNRGAAIDLTLYDLKTGKTLDMGTGFDHFSDTAHHDFKALSEQVLQNRQLLKETMMKQGFIALSTEWWHYSWPDAAKRFPLMDLSFKDMKRLTR